MLFHIRVTPSIGSIARMEIVSRQAGVATGQRLRVDGGKKDELRAAPAAPGTTIEIKDIFFNTPARRTFLNAPATVVSVDEKTGKAIVKIQGQKEDKTVAISAVSKQ